MLGRLRMSKVIHITTCGLVHLPCSVLEMLHSSHTQKDMMHSSYTQKDAIDAECPDSATWHYIKEGVAGKWKWRMRG